MKHHYWKAPIVIYLFLGGLGGGIMFFSALFDFFIAPGSGELFVFPIFIALASLAIGCFFLVFELGQPLVFWRVWTTATAIIKWGATLLVIAMFSSFFWWISYLPWEWIKGIADFFTGMRPVLLAIFGITGFGIMVYTGIMLSTLKAHAFWATPALPILFTISAMSTGCAAITLTLGGWPTVLTFESVFLGTAILQFVHVTDIVLVFAELTVLLIMILSFLGAGNKVTKKVAQRWVKGKTAPLFWIGMVGLGLVIPFLMYIFAPQGFLATVVAPVLVLCGGLLLRYLCVYSDERAEIPGEDRYYTRCASRNAEFISKWTYGDNIY